MHLNAYEGVERLESFEGASAIAAYRSSMLERSMNQASFLEELLPDQATVFEVGSGNGRMLMALALRGSLREGLGLDLARSRVDFAKRWAADEGLELIQFRVADVLEHPLPSDYFSAALCLTGAFAYFEAMQRSTGFRLAEQLHAALAPGGLLCLEVYPFRKERALLDFTGGEAHTWKELPAEDPWRFYLSHLRLNDRGDVLSHTKTFIHRRGAIDEGRAERLYLYDEDELRDLLARAGFCHVTLHEGWTSAEYAGGDVMVLTARKPQ